MKHQTPYIFAGIISIFSLFIISTVCLTYVFSHRQNTPIIPLPETVYVYLENTYESETESEEKSGVWLITEHKERIGIFDRDGNMIKLIDIYIKTLPRNDQTELREGIWVSSEKELYSIIEAYSD